ncbi:TolC family protein [bacterium]
MKIQKMIMYFLIVFFIGSNIYCADSIEHGKNIKLLSLGEFIKSASKYDTMFEEILIDNLKLNYQKDLGLPAKDIILSVKAQYDMYLSQDRDDPETTLSLTKLFPFTGTDMSLSYKNSPSFSSETSSSELSFLISQPIAENAFGKTTRIKDKIIGIEIDLARHQIIEAYEDYMAVLVSVYYDWYSAYENLKAGGISYAKNLKLQDNIYLRRKQRIALPIDVNKIKLLVLGKSEDVISLKENYDNLANLIKKAIRYESDTELQPVDPSAYHDIKIEFNTDYKKFTEMSRTYKILELMEKQSSLEVNQFADELLPSTNLLIGYKVQGDDWQIEDEDDLLYTGLSFELPFTNQVTKAVHELSKIEHKKTQLSNKNKYLELYTNLKNLSLKIQRERELIKIADEKIELSLAILKDEAENYSFGKVTLNDYIDAVNTVDQYNFNKISHMVQLKKLIIEWLRLTDQLIGNASVPLP